MKKTISTLTLAVVSCGLFSVTSQAQSRLGETIIEQRTTTEMVDIPIVEERRARVVSGETLAGRRQPIANDAVIVNDGDEQRAIIREGNDLDRPKIRGFLGADEVELDD